MMTRSPKEVLCRIGSGKAVQQGKMLQVGISESPNHNR